MHLNINDITTRKYLPYTTWTDHEWWFVNISIDDCEGNLPIGNEISWTE